MSKQAELEAERFIHRAMQYLRSTFREQTRDTDDETLKNKLIDDCQTALKYGFDTESDMMMIVDFLWRLPADYTDRSEYEWVQDILTSEEMDNEMKIDALHNAFAMVCALQEDEQSKKEQLNDR